MKRTIDITSVKDKYVLEGWDKLVSFEDYLSILAQRAHFDACATGIEREKSVTHDH